jgi:hypothetical protein
VSTPEGSLARLVLRFIQTRDHPAIEVRDGALNDLAESLERVVWQRLADEPELDPRYGNLDGLMQRTIEVPTPQSVHITGAFYFLHDRGHLMLPMEAHLTVEPNAPSSVRVASLNGLFDMPESEREFRRGIERASWRYSFELHLA